MPAYGFFVRHATEVDFTNVRLDTEQEDLRPAVSLEDVKGANFLNVNWRHVPQAPSIVLKNVEKFNVRDCPVLPDTRLERAEKQQF